MNLIVVDENFIKNENGAMVDHLVKKGRQTREDRRKFLRDQTEKSLRDMVTYFRTRKKKNKRGEAEYIMQRIYGKNYKGME